MIPELGPLRRRLGAGGVLEQEVDRVSRALDLWPQGLGRPRDGAPEAVLLPEHEEQVAACLDWASATGARLAVRGAGSGVLGAAAPDPGAVVLECTRLKSVFKVIEGPTPAVLVSAGWLGGELERRLSSLGWALCHVPQSLECSSVGGWLAHDGFGQLSTRYGGVRRQTLAVRVAGLDGRVRALSPDLYLGSEGTLGVITEATLQIRPKPIGRRFFSWNFGGLTEAADFARLLAASSPPPSVLRACGPVDRLVHRFGHGNGGSRLMAEVERLLLSRLSWIRALAGLAGRRWTVIAIYEDEPLFRGFPEQVRLAPAAGEGPARGWWSHRFAPDADRLRRVFERGCFADTVDLWAPYGAMGRIEAAVLEAVAPHAFAYAHLSHLDAHGACLYVTLAGTGGPQVHERAWRAALDACAAAGGGVNHHHGVGRAKSAWLEVAMPAARREALRAARRRSDPAGLLNPWLRW